ncbi:MAG: metallophosphoesterase [Flavobacteriales bacterium]
MLIGFILFLVVFVGLLVLLDWYSIKALKSVLKGRFKKWMLYAWISPTVFMLLFMLGFFIFRPEYPRGVSNQLAYTVSAISFTTIATKATIFLFHLLDDIKQFFNWLWKKIFQPEPTNTEGGRISRGNFLTQMGIGISAITFGSFSYGVTRGKYNYTVVKQPLSFDNLPTEFDGLKIIHISDLHLGSFLEDAEPVQHGFDLINELEADYIFFTGDLVNSVAEEAEFWVPYLNSLKAKRGKFSILGNHDYGEYAFPDDSPELVSNMVQLKRIHKDMGFDLLLNENRKLEKDGKTIDLIGVENWGKVLRFPRKGDFEAASSGLNPSDFNILLSHDPTHWEEKIMVDKDVNLTLSGHTHGFQLGVGLGDYKWSPASLTYKRWKGLYEENNKFLYVNPGFGFLGFPGRVNMAPEITLFELSSTQVSKA